jgi:hypothetical protein
MGLIVFLAGIQTILRIFPGWRCLKFYSLLYFAALLLSRQVISIARDIDRAIARLAQLVK